MWRVWFDRDTARIAETDTEAGRCARRRDRIEAEAETVKYIVYQNSRFPDFRAPALFHEIIPHDTFPREYRDINGVIWKAVSAGFWNGETASGQSVSLKLSSQATDTADIRMMLEERT